MKKLQALFAAVGIILTANAVKAATFAGGQLVETVASTATAAGTTTLVLASPHHQRFTGSTTQTVVMPSALTLKAGMSWVISNDSSGTVTVQQNGGSTIGTLIGGEAYQFMLISAATPGGTWDAVPFGGAAISSLTGDVTAAGPGAAAATIAASSVTSNKILDDTITNADINSAAGIADTKLATISTAGKVSNSATTATASNTMSAIMARDSSGQVAASTFTGDLVGNVTGAVTGNASTATALAADPADCGASSLAQGITASGAASCRAVDDAAISSSAAITRSKTASGTAYVVLANNSAGVMSENAAITGSRAVASDANGQLVASATTATQLGYLSTATSDIQTQINAVSAGASTIQSYEITNVGITATVAANALTIGLTQANGSACTTGSAACKIGFRSSTRTSGQFVQRAVTYTPSSLVISSGSTLGHAAGVNEWIYVYAIDNGGTVELAAGASTVDAGTLFTTTAEGGAGAADSRTTIYSASARTNVPIRLIGRIQILEATAGTWASAPLEISVWPFERGSVNTNSNYRERIERASMSGTACSSSPCTIARQSGQWLTSITRTSAGLYVLNIASGVFSQPPTCSFTTLNFGGSTAPLVYASSAATTTSVNPQFLASGGATLDVAFDVICMGPQ